MSRSAARKGKGHCSIHGIHSTLPKTPLCLQTGFFAYYKPPFISSVRLGPGEGNKLYRRSRRPKEKRLWRGPASYLHSTSLQELSTKLKAATRFPGSAEGDQPIGAQRLPSAVCALPIDAIKTRKGHSESRASGPKFLTDYLRTTREGTF